MIKRLLINTSSNLLVLTVKLIIVFIMTPVFLQNMGNYDYGIWEIIASVVGYMGILDLGIKPAIIRFTAKYKVENNNSALREIYSSAFAFTLLMGIILCTTLICWGMFFPETLAPDSSSTTKYTLVLTILALQMLMMFPGYVPESLLEGLQQYSVKNNVTIVNSIIGASVLFYFISPNNALYLLALVNAVGLSIKYALYFYLVSRPKYGQLVPTVSYVSLAKIKQLLHFGGKSFIQGLAYQIESATDVLVIGYFLNPALVPLYSIPANLMGHIRNVGFTLTQAFMPKFSQLAAEKNSKATIDFYINASKWTIALILPISILAVIFGPAFISLWLGKEYGENSQLILLLLAIFTMLPFLDPVMERYLTAINKHAILAKLYPISALINLVASILLVNKFGIVGVALGSIIPLCILVPVYLVYSCKQLEITLYHYIKNVLVPLLVPNLVLVFLSFLMTNIYSFESYLSLIFVGLGLIIFYGGALWYLTLNRREKKVLKRKYMNLFYSKRMNN